MTDHSNSNHKLIMVFSQIKNTLEQREFRLNQR
jgi:hypothetical protein